MARSKARSLERLLLLRSGKESVELGIPFVPGAVLLSTTDSLQAAHTSTLVTDI